MPFMTKCPGCGKGLQVPDAAARQAGEVSRLRRTCGRWPSRRPTPGRPPRRLRRSRRQLRPRNARAAASDIQIPASMAGKRVKCPGCSHVWQVPGPVVDAEEVPELPALESRFDDLISDSYPLAKDIGGVTGPAGQPAAAGEPPRRPCPMCGEMIVVGAAKCRFCNAIFDETLKRTEKKKKRKGGSDEDLTPSEWVFCIICPGLVCIAGLIYLIMGKPKALKLIGASFLFAVIWNIIFFIIGSLANTPGPHRGF